MSFPRRFLRVSVADALVLLLCVASLAEISLRAPGWRAVALAPFALLWTLPLLGRRSRAVFAALTVLGAAALSMALSGRTVSSAMWVAMLAGFYALGRYEPHRARAVAAAIVGVALLLVVAVSDQGLHPLVFPSAAILGFGAFVGGRAVRRRAQRAAELAELTQRLELMQEEETQIAVAEERARIATELNELIARAISGMITQAGAARLLLRDDPAQARIGIEAVEETGREALAETRRLLRVLRSERPTREPPVRLAALERRVNETSLGETAVMGGAP
jgi:signal transduction histidine kinase